MNLIHVPVLLYLKITYIYYLQLWITLAVFLRSIRNSVNCEGVYWIEIIQDGFQWRAYSARK